VAGVSLALRVPSVYAVLAFAFAAFALVANVQEFVTGTRARMRAHGENPLRALGRLVSGNNRRYGGYIAHIGVVAAAAGIAASSTFRTERELTLRPGETVTVRGYTVRFDELSAKEESHRFVVGAKLSVVDGTRVYDRLDPKLNFYRGGAEPITTPGVRSRLHNDLYVNLLAFERDGSSATLHVIVEPLVAWIWLGGVIVAVGAAVGIVPTRRRERRKAYASANAGVAA
jgi:cytochrome c-type biogenesis protein CcmF